MQQGAEARTLTWNWKDNSAFAAPHSLGKTFHPCATLPCLQSSGCLGKGASLTPLLYSATGIPTLCATTAQSSTSVSPEVIAWAPFSTHRTDLSWQSWQGPSQQKQQNQDSGSPFSQQHRLSITSSLLLCVKSQISDSSKVCHGIADPVSEEIQFSSAQVTSFTTPPGFFAWDAVPPLLQS